MVAGFLFLDGSGNTISWLVLPLLRLEWDVIVTYSLEWDVDVYLNTAMFTTNPVRKC
jgi:hypothetical protein